MAAEKIDACSDAFGYVEVPKHPYLYSNGKTAYLPDSAKREYPSNNGIIFLRGGTPWRPPSNYRREIRNWKNVLSYKTSSSSGWGLIGGNHSGAILHTNFGGYWSNMDIVEDASLINEAQTEALNRLAGEKAQLGVMFGEAKRTFSLLSSYAIPLLQAYRAARRGNWSRVQLVLGLRRENILWGKYPANKWLEYQYGWKPLLTDLYETHERFRELLKTQSFLIHGSGRAEKSADFDSTWSGTGQPSVAKHFSGVQTVRTKLTAEIDSQRWRSASQFGLINPLSVGWELVPFSFLLDWFMPVGNTLEAMTARAGLKFVGGSTSIVSGGRVDMRTIATSGMTIRSHGTLTIQRFGLRRYAHTSWPMPGLYVNNSPFSTKRSLNALALFRSTQFYR